MPSCFRTLHLLWDEESWRGVTPPSDNFGVAQWGPLRGAEWSLSSNLRDFNEFVSKSELLRDMPDRVGFYGVPIPFAQARKMWPECKLELVATVLLPCDDHDEQERANMLANRLLDFIQGLVCIGEAAWLPAPQRSIKRQHGPGQYDKSYSFYQEDQAAARETRRREEEGEDEKANKKNKV